MFQVDCRFVEEAFALTEEMEHSRYRLMLTDGIHMMDEVEEG
jgi:hypothetical protein